MIFNFCLVEEFACRVVFLFVCKVTENNPFLSIRAFVVSNGISFALIKEIVNSLGLYKKKKIIFSHYLYFIEMIGVVQYNSNMSKIHETADKIKNEVCQVFKGNPDIIDMVLASLFAGGHVLLEDLPGTGKTVLAKALAKASGLAFSRVQCTPDLMPSDVTGSSVWLPDSKKFEFRAGPVMTSILLVDELNRATPRTQSALLECMAEGQVSVDGVRHQLEKPFFVLATENPVESEGTFPLPEAQKDRFMMTLSMGYPSQEQEAEIITAQRSLVHPVENVKAVVSKDEILDAMKEAVEVHVDEAVLTYLLNLTKASREDIRIAAGLSPRGSIALYKACQAYAAVQGRTFVTPEDVKLLALPVMRKRIILTSDSMLKGYSADSIIKDLIESVPLPAFKAHV